MYQKVVCYLCGTYIRAGEGVTLIIRDTKDKTSMMEFACNGYEALLAGASYVAKGFYAIEV
jgi:hypothetical protein